MVFYYGGIMKTILRNLKGTSDYSPEEQCLREDLFNALKDVFRRYGYESMETPILSYFNVLASKYAGGAEILSEIYRLSDQGKRDLGLRYDLTVPFARFIGMNPNLSMPFRRFEIGKVFRDGPVKAGRKREFYQCDVDVIGASSIAAEAELFSMTVDIFDQFGLDICIEYNSRNVLIGIIKSVGIAEYQIANVITTIDKLEKIGIENVRTELNVLGLSSKCINSLFKFIDAIKEDINVINDRDKFNNELNRGFTEVDNLRRYLRAIGIENKTKFKPSLARGLEIYTGIVWEVFLIDRSITSSLGAGGRYDSIIGAFLDSEVEYPAVGMTFGLDVIYEVISMKNEYKNTPQCEIYIIPLGNMIECMKIASEIRACAISVCLDISGKKLRKALNYANKSGIQYTLVLGDDEMDTGTAYIKDMKSGVSYEINLNIVSESIMKVLK